RPPTGNELRNEQHLPRPRPPDRHPRRPRDRLLRLDRLGLLRNCAKWSGYLYFSATAITTCRRAEHRPPWLRQSWSGGLGWSGLEAGVQTRARLPERAAPSVREAFLGLQGVASGCSEDLPEYPADRRRGQDT